MQGDALKPVTATVLPVSADYTLDYDKNYHGKAISYLRFVWPSRDRVHSDRLYQHAKKL